jgi:hypothetical protein
VGRIGASASNDCVVSKGKRGAILGAVIGNQVADRHHRAAPRRPER